VQILGEEEKRELTPEYYEESNEIRRHIDVRREY
jgi:hypothetical protein